MPTLRTAAQICDHGLAPPERRAALGPGCRALCGGAAARLGRADRSQRSARPDRAPVRSRARRSSIISRKNSATRSATTRTARWKASCTAIPTACCSSSRMSARSIAASVSAARWSVPGKPNALSPAALARALDYIRGRPEIWEVILTGGDPLVLSARRLRAVMKALAAIEHVKVVRIHTRVPVADPARITPELVRAIKVKGKPTYVAVHVNHARELTPRARAACARMADAGIPLLAQSVLLAGVNDTPEVLGELMRALVECRIKPYYLHHGDLAPGTAHLRTDIATGQDLMRSLRGRLSGLCQPAYVLDIPGGHGKSPIGPNYIERTGANGGEHFVVEDFNGRRHRYPPRKTR